MAAMKLVPSVEEMQQLLKYKEYDIIPVKAEIYADNITPIEVMRILKNISKHCFILESVEDQVNWGRYTFIGYDPILEFTVNEHKMRIRSGMTIEKEVEDPAVEIRNILKDYKSPRMEDFPTFTGGLVGYFSYDYIKYAEPTLKIDAADEEGFKDVDLMLFDKVIAFDNLKQKIVFIANVRTDNLDVNYKKAANELLNMKNLIMTGEKAEIQPLRLKEEFKPLFSKDEFCEMVEKAKHYIYEGDIFQVVLSNRMEAKYEGSMFDAYRVLRTLNPSPYMFYFSSNDIEMAGASPETLVKLNGTKLFTYPLAGTRKRGKDDAEDEKIIEGLLADEKECAEHNMLVDLGRNDMGRISMIGSVKVEKYMQILKFSHVMHIGSTVTGTIRNGMDACDAVSSILPAGTLSGAPKYRACQIINELENNKRGIYGGAIGYIDFTGNLDTCIAIRIAYARNGKVFVRSGAGIVADSVPENEYQECINKAAAVVTAIHEAEGGLE